MYPSETSPLSPVGFRGGALPLFLFAVTILLILTSVSHADPPVFAAPQMLEADGEQIVADGSGYYAPCVGDWDGDGDLDLMVGTFDGLLYLYLNTAEEGAPELEEQEPLSADGERIDYPSG